MYSRDTWKILTEQLRLLIRMDGCTLVTLGNGFLWVKRAEWWCEWWWSLCINLNLHCSCGSLQNGTLKVIDRKKHIFKLAQGEYIAPEKIETIYVRSDPVAQVFVHGDSLQVRLKSQTFVSFFFFLFFKSTQIVCLKHLILIWSMLCFKGMPGGDSGARSWLLTYLGQEKRVWRLLLWAVWQQGPIYYYQQSERGLSLCMPV